MKGRRPANNRAQRFGSFYVCGDRNFATQVRFECIDSTDVIRMQMRDDDLAHLPALGDHFVDARRQRVLFILPG